MYDLPSEDPEEPGLPDEFHDLQPELLSRTFRSPLYPPNRVFTGTDMNLYYDVRHQLWHKRPDWFLVLDVPRLYDDTDLRMSYVMWQEGISPFVIVELLSPGTAKEDLGENANSDPEAIELDTLPDNAESPTAGEEDTESPLNGEIPTKETPPRKWEVYERILRVPYYVVFSRYTNKVHFFKLEGGRYQQQSFNPEQPRIWIAEIELGLGLWRGEYSGITRQWLRWYDASGNWLPTDGERAEQAETRAEQAESQLRQVVLNLLQSGMEIEQVASLTGLSIAQVQQLLGDGNGEF